MTQVTQYCHRKKIYWLQKLQTLIIYLSCTILHCKNYYCNLFYIIWINGIKICTLSFVQSLLQLILKTTIVQVNYGSRCPNTSIPVIFNLLSEQESMKTKVKDVTTLETCCMHTCRHNLQTKQKCLGMENNQNVSFEYKMHNLYKYARYISAITPWSTF